MLGIIGITAHFIYLIIPGRQVFMRNLLFLTMFFLSSIAHASISITGTRVIYNESDRSVAVKLNNQGDSASVVQAWIDNKNTNQSPGDGVSPFILYPAVSKVVGGGEQYLRIKKIETIPNTETESLFWLNVKDIPEAPKDKDQNHLQLSILSKIKLFYRPAALKNKSGDMYKDLSWGVRNSNGKSYLTVKNNSRFYASFTDTKFKDSSKQKGIALDMVAPGASAEWLLNGEVLAGINKGQAEYGIVNDYGAVVYRPISLH